MDKNGRSLNSIFLGGGGGGLDCIAERRETLLSIRHSERTHAVFQYLESSQS